MNLSIRMVVLLGLVLTLSVTVRNPVRAQTITSVDDGTTLKQIIIFGRHSIRASTIDPSELSYCDGS